MITEINDTACTLGAIKSIVLDSKIYNGDQLIKEIQNRTVDTVTTIRTDEIEDVLKKYYSFVHEIDLDDEDVGVNLLDIYPSNSIDNINSFCLMLWLGNDTGNNRHAVRLISFNSLSIIYLDSTKEQKFNVINLDDLHEITPKGVILFFLSKKEIESLKPKKQFVYNENDIWIHPDNNYIDFLRNDDTIYHYTKSNTALKILLGMNLKGSKTENFSDPNENFLHSPGSSGDGDIGKKTDEIEAEINNNFKNWNIFSFCSNTQVVGDTSLGIGIKDVRNYQNSTMNSKKRLEYLLFPNYGYNKDRMWDMYGEQSNGVCLIFSKNDLIKSIDKSIIPEHGLIQYHKQLFDAIGGLNCNNNKHYEAKNFIISKLMKKSFDYRDENEYRFLLYSDSKEKMKINIKESLKGIIFGINFDLDDLQLYKNILENQYGINHKILLFKSCIDKGIPNRNFTIL